MLNILLSEAFEGQQVRVFGSPEQPWFKVSDVCAVLGIENPRNVYARLEDWMKYDAGDNVPVDVPDGVHTMDTIEYKDRMGRAQDVNLVNEAGLYELIFGSRKESAKAFKRWVFSEVLPSIRKTGRYSVESPLSLTERVLHSAQVAKEIAPMIDLLKTLGRFDAQTRNMLADSILVPLGMCPTHPHFQVDFYIPGDDRTALQHLAVLLSEAHAKINGDSILFLNDTEGRVIRTREDELMVAIATDVIASTREINPMALVAMGGQKGKTARLGKNPVRCWLFPLDQCIKALKAERKQPDRLPVRLPPELIPAFPACQNPGKPIL
jgi:prophage antirepressor-like protein